MGERFYAQRRVTRPISTIGIAPGISKPSDKLLVGTFVTLLTRFFISVKYVTPFDSAFLPLARHGPFNIIYEALIKGVCYSYPNTEMYCAKEPDQSNRIEATCRIDRKQRRCGKGNYSCIGSWAQTCFKYWDLTTYIAFSKFRPHLQVSFHFPIPTTPCWFPCFRFRSPSTETGCIFIPCHKLL